MLCFVMDYELSYMSLRCQVICYVSVRHFRKIAKSDYYLHHAHLSVRMEQLALTLDGFSWNFIFEFTSKICRKNSSIITAFTWIPMCVTISSCSALIMWNVSHKSCKEIKQIHFIFNNFFFRQSCRFWDNVGKYGTARHATDDNIIWWIRFACLITKWLQMHIRNI